ncbi:hypothetical protein PIB30_080039 [Stylosanthes scabra]|uniref:GRF-type domain-containing protein n=1 Tax=Stylosanthes scabra TaxID=79078 RepID=A0ABU6XQ84_9FABA|nr:hypothetical protein [Stylosanthes scabra]
MGSSSGGRFAQLTPQSVGSFDSNSFMRRRKKNMDRCCFCGLKTLIKKSSTSENPGRLFHTCPRYREGSHCNYFKWVDESEYEVVEGANEGAEANAEVDSGHKNWKVNLECRLASLEAEVKALRIGVFFMFSGLTVIILVVVLLFVSSMYTK